MTVELWQALAGGVLIGLGAAILVGLLTPAAIFGVPFRSCSSP
jgi:hypothetical protein